MKLLRRTKRPKPSQAEETQQRASIVWWLKRLVRWKLATKVKPLLTLSQRCTLRRGAVSRLRRTLLQQTQQNAAGRTLERTQYSANNSTSSSSASSPPATVCASEEAADPLVSLLPPPAWNSFRSSRASRDNMGLHVQPPHSGLPPIRTSLTQQAVGHTGSPGIDSESYSVTARASGQSQGHHEQQQLSERRSTEPSTEVDGSNPFGGSGSPGTSWAAGVGGGVSNAAPQGGVAKVKGNTASGYREAPPASASITFARARPRLTPGVEDELLAEYAPHCPQQRFDALGAGESCSSSDAQPGRGPHGGMAGWSAAAIAFTSARAEAALSSTKTWKRCPDGGAEGGSNGAVVPHLASLRRAGAFSALPRMQVHANASPHMSQQQQEQQQQQLRSSSAAAAGRNAAVPQQPCASDDWLVAVVRPPPELLRYVGQQGKLRSSNQGRLVPTPLGRPGNALRPAGAALPQGAPGAAGARRSKPTQRPSSALPSISAAGSRAAAAGPASALADKPLSAFPRRPASANPSSAPRKYPKRALPRPSPTPAFAVAAPGSVLPTTPKIIASAAPHWLRFHNEIVEARSANASAKSNKAATNDNVADNDDLQAQAQEQEQVASSQGGLGTMRLPPLQPQSQLGDDRSSLSPFGRPEHLTQQHDCLADGNTNGSAADVFDEDGLVGFASPRMDPMASLKALLPAASRFMSSSSCGGSVCCVTSSSESAMHAHLQHYHRHYNRQGSSSTALTTASTVTTSIATSAGGSSFSAFPPDSCSVSTEDVVVASSGMAVLPDRPSVGGGGAGHSRFCAASSSHDDEVMLLHDGAQESCGADHGVQCGNALPSTHRSLPTQQRASVIAAWQ